MQILIDIEKRPTPSLLNLNWRALPAREVSKNVFRPNLAAKVDRQFPRNL